ncbi:MAG: hypothetical protein ACXABY_22740 [Candidatus Thorarchaeota archaeon]|jgi:hypothetical protein
MMDVDEIEIQISKEKLVSIINTVAKKLDWTICDSCGFLDISENDMVEFLQALLPEIGPVNINVKDD